MLGLLKIGVFTFFWLPLVAVVLYAFGLTVYRLFLSPLAKFPGPRLAALTRKYESYYEAVQNYEYLWKIKQMHQKYGKFERVQNLEDEKLITFIQVPSSASARTNSMWMMSSSLIV